MCDEERLGGSRSTSGAGTDGRGVAGRATESRSTPRIDPGIDPDIDAAVERGIAPRTRGGRRYHAPPVRSAVPLELVVLQQRGEFLDELNRHFGPVATGVRGERFDRAHAALRAGEIAFREGMAEAGDGPISPDLRSRLLQTFDEAYESSSRDWGARPYWQGLYRDPQTRAVLNRARDSGLLHFNDDAVSSGRSPRVRSFDRAARQTWEVLNIDHAVPRERNPFRAFDPANLRILPERENQRYLQRFSGRSAFPMGEDDIERFTMRHGLARRRRFPIVPLAGIIAGLGTLIGSDVAYAEFQEAAVRFRRDRARRERSRVRVREAYPELEGALHDLNRVFGDREPTEVHGGSSYAFARAIERTADELEPGGSEDERIRSRVEQPRGGMDTQEWLGVTIIPELLDYRNRLDRLSTEVGALLSRREEYLQRAERLLAPLATEELEGLVETAIESYAADIQDALDVLDQRMAVGAAFRGYVDKLERIAVALDRMSLYVSAWIGEVQRRIEAP